MSAPKNAQYQAYSVATRTVAKTRQIVMLYDGTIRFIKQAQQAISEGRIEDRFNLLKRAAGVMNGLAGSIDFENGGEVANTLLTFYTNMSVRIMGVNFQPKEGYTLCEGVIDDLKQMRDVWAAIDQSLTTTPEAMPDMPITGSTAAAASVTLSA